MRLSELAEGMRGKIVAGRPSGRVSNKVSIDSRTVKAGETFIALSGERFDGHKFVKSAGQKGARTIVVSKQSSIRRCPKGVNIILVDDTHEALLDIARFVRKKYTDIPVVGLTGSSGKTTTKEIIRHLFSGSGKVLANKGNQNNLIGLPLNLVRLNSGYDIGVFEMAMNHQGEIKKLSDILRPDLALFTNIGDAHIGFFGSKEKIFNAKREILSGLKPGGALIVNADDVYLRRLLRLKNRRVISYGIDRGADFRATAIRKKGHLTEFTLKGIGAIRIERLGHFQIYNVLAACACARFFGLSPREIAARLKGIRWPAMRSEIKNIGGMTFVFDCYNANPSSVVAVCEAFSAGFRDCHRVAVVGDMRELGAMSRRLHQKVGRHLAALDLEEVIAVGEEAKNIYNAVSLTKNPGMRFRWCRTAKEAALALKDIPRSRRRAVLLKGSREMRMEEIVQCYTTSFTR